MCSNNIGAPSGSKLPRWAKTLLASCPKSGDGVHNWVYRAAKRLHSVLDDEDEIVALLLQATAACGREVGDREIRDAVVNSAPSADPNSDQNKGAPRWPYRIVGRIWNVLRTGPGLEELKKNSPVHWDDGQPHTEEIIDCLFPGNPLICAGGRKERALTRSREEWRGFLDKQQFIVPSPMSAAYGVTQSGDKSMRTLANTGPRRFLVVEFDQGNFDEHSKLLFHLSGFVPLVLVVHSGNKSLHGWFHCNGQGEEKINEFFRYAVSLGADRATWTPCQWVRMPDGRRDNGKLQTVVFFNPSAVSSL
jgi:hypothetical protein